MTTTKNNPPLGAKSAQKTSKKVNNQKIDVDLTQYHLALTDPFHPGAVGAKVPDQYATPTITQTVRASLTLTANSAGEIGALVFPNPVASTYLYAGNGSDFSTITWGDNTTTTQARWGVDPTTFASKFDNYRIVGYGIRVTGLSSMTNASGKFIMGSYPVQSKWVTKDFPVGGVTMATNANFTHIATETDWGMPVASGSHRPSLLVNLPGSTVVSAIEAAENVYEITPRISSPEALNWRDSGDSVIGTDIVGQTGAPLNSVTTGSAGYLELNGFEAAYVYYTGGVASTSSIDLEVIYHLEGKPNLNTGSTQAITGIVPQNAVAPSPVKPIGMLKVVEAAAKEPVVHRVVETAAGMIHPMLGSLAGKILRAI